MHARILIIVSLIMLASTAFGCRPSQQELKMMEEARGLLREAGVDPSTLEKDGDDMTITYEASKAFDYDEQILADWGAIFGILQWYAMDDVHIVITIDGKPVAKVKADVDNIKKFSKGEMSRENFLNKITVSVVS